MMGVMVHIYWCLVYFVVRDHPGEIIFHLRIMQISTLMCDRWLSGEEESAPEELKLGTTNFTQIENISHNGSE